MGPGARLQRERLYDRPHQVPRTPLKPSGRLAARPLPQAAASSWKVATGVIGRGRFAVASLKDSTLRIFEFANDGVFVNQVVVTELDGTYGRLRTPMMGPDGALFVTTSNGSNDKILRVEPEDGVTELPRPSCPRHITQSGSNGDGSLGGFGPAPVAPKFDDGFRTKREVPENAEPGDPVGDPVAATHVRTNSRSRTPLAAPTLPSSPLTSTRASYAC